MRTASLSLDTIRLDGGTQCRAELHQEYIAGMAEAWSDGAKIPAVVVFHDGSAYWLADGFHRYHAAQKCDFRDIEAEIHSGTRTDAVRYALGANSAHGQPRTNADKRRAVEIALKEFPKLSSVELAGICAVGRSFVDNIRPHQPATVAGCETRIGRDGKERKVPARAPSPALPREDDKPAPREIVVPFVVPPQRSQEKAQPTEEPLRDAGGMTEAATLWLLAKGRLDQIRKADPHRVDTLRAIISYCETRITNNK